jgi:nucleolar protein 4
LDKRKREQAEKKTKLRNPFFFVSPTRLSIRNLGRTILDNDFRALLVQAVQKGLEAENVTSDDLKMHFRAQGLYEQASDPKCLVVSVPRPRDIHVKVKVMRDLDKKPEDGVYPSRGYGFADFSSHVHALAALRHVNNNPAFASYAVKGGGGKRSRLIVSFAVENHKALQKKILRGEKVRTAAAPEATWKGAASGRGASLPKKRKLVEGDGKEDGSGAAESSGNGATDVGEKKLSRGQRQRELKRQRKRADGANEGPARRTRTGAISVGKLGKAAAALHQRSEKRTPASAPGNDKPERRPPLQPDSRGSSRGRGGVEEEGDNELNRLVAAVATGGEAKKGRRKSGVQKESNEDKQFVSTVHAYKQKLLGGGSVGVAGKGAEEGAGTGKGKAERWFE